MDGLLQAWQEGPLGLAMRTSPLAYPVAEILHIIGFTLLIGSIVGLDLRLLGFGRTLPVAALARLVLPIAIGGFVLAVCMGLLLFSADATHVAVNPSFRIKLALIGLALLNILLLHRGVWREVGSWQSAVPPRAQVAALLSIVFWLGALTAGRLIAYF